ncbi:MAG: GAF domain-containing protein [Pseudomonadota bacterium]
MGDETLGLPPVLRELLDDAVRLEIVAATELVGTGSERVFDELSATAAMALSAPVAQVTLMEAHRQWFKSSRGFPLQEAPTTTSFCAYALASKDAPTIVADATLDKRFMMNPFVMNEPHIRFYAGMPIVLDGHSIGSVCVYDFEPRNDVTPQQIATLRYLADNAAKIIEARMDARIAAEA